MDTQVPPAWYEAVNGTAWRCGHRHVLISNAAACLTRAAVALTREGDPIDGLQLEDSEGRVVVPQSTALAMGQDGPSGRLRLYGGPFDHQLVAPPTHPWETIAIADEQYSGRFHRYVEARQGLASYIGYVDLCVRIAEVA